MKCWKSFRWKLVCSSVMRTCSSYPYSILKAFFEFSSTPTRSLSPFMYFVALDSHNNVNAMQSFPGARDIPFFTSHSIYFICHVVDSSRHQSICVFCFAIASVFCQSYSMKYYYSLPNFWVFTTIFLFTWFINTWLLPGPMRFSCKALKLVLTCVDFACGTDNSLD